MNIYHRLVLCSLFTCICSYFYIYHCSLCTQIEHISLCTVPWSTMLISAQRAATWDAAYWRRLCIFMGEFPQAHAAASVLCGLIWSEVIVLLCYLLLVITSDKFIQSVVTFRQLHQIAILLHIIWRKMCGLILFLFQHIGLQGYSCWFVYSGYIKTL